MKIGIMTWYNYNNYGTKLQAVALSTFLEKNNNEVRLINYKPRSVKKELLYRHNIKDKIKNKIKNKKNILYSKNDEIFEKFSEKYYKETEPCDSYVDLYQLNNIFDCFICGSDQIWNPTNFNSKYFLDFANKEKIISYAPSFGVSEINNEIIKKEMMKYIDRFNYLSVREKHGATIIKDLCNKNAQVVVDPTLLLDKKEWNSFENNDFNQKYNNKRYLVSYFLGESNKYIKKIEKFALNNDLSIINIPVYENKKINKYNLDESIGPSELLSLIKNSQCVITDSFHGMVFSIIYNKEFFVYKRFSTNNKKNQNSRIISLLEQLELSDRIIDNKCKFDNKPIDYTKVNLIVNSICEKSKTFLKNSLFKIKNNEKNVENEKNRYEITDYCSGCGACVSICPTGALKINVNDDGFQHYSIKKEKCIHCGLCKKVCPMLHLDTNLIDKKMDLYSLISKNENVLATSSSGGASYLITELLNKDYYICGCYYNNEEDKAEHIIIEPNNYTKLKKIQGSKYIQSNTAVAFKKMLEIGKDNKVLFLGTPCQVAGLDKLTKIKKIRDNFLLVDIICHGVPSYNLWKKYLNDLIKKYPILKSNHRIIMRDGTLGKNRSYVIKIYSQDKLIYKNTKSKDDFYKFFTDGTIRNKSCFECPYRKKMSSDIRIGDFWGKKFKKNVTGVSMVIPGTKKGIEVFNLIKNSNKADVHKQDINDYFLNQQPSNQIIPYYREKMLNDLKNDNYQLKKIRKNYFKFEDIKSGVIGKYKKLKGIVKNEK